MKSMKVVAFLAFLLNTILFATYYAIAKEALERIDPIMFTFFEIATLAPAGLCIVIFTWKAIRWPIIKQGFLLGSCLSLALFTIAIALKYTTATGTAFFPALNGFLAALIAWVFLRQPVTKATWCAGLLSTIGVTLLIMNSPMGGIRGVLIAFLGGLFFTGYVFLSDHHPQDAHTPQTKAMPVKDDQRSTNVELTLFGIELLTMAVWACLIALLFGDWEAIHMSLPKDGLVILYVAGACTFLPTLLTVLMQKHTSPVTVSFIYILEPVFSAIIAMLYLHEMLPLYGYLGGILVVAGAIIHTSGTLWQKHTSSTKAESAHAGIMPSRSAHSPHPTHTAHTTYSAQPSAETIKLLGLRLTSSTAMAAPPATVAAHMAGYGHSGSPVFTTTEPLPVHLQRTHIARTPSTQNATAHNGRSTYAIGAIEWIDDDICERPTRPVLNPQPARATRDLSVWLNANIANQPAETLPTTQKSRVRTTDDLRELSLPMRTPMPHSMRPSMNTPIPPTDAREQLPQHAKSAGKGPVWLEEDANATKIASIFSQNTVAHNYHQQPVERVELAEFLD